jgi:hypothetical protein
LLLSIDVHDWQASTDAPAVNLQRRILANPSRLATLVHKGDADWHVGLRVGDPVDLLPDVV